MEQVLATKGELHNKKHHRRGASERENKTADTRLFQSTSNKKQEESTRLQNYIKELYSTLATAPRTRRTAAKAVREKKETLKRLARVHRSLR